MRLLATLLSRRRWVLVALLVAGALVGAASAGVVSSAAPDLTGTWKVFNTSGPGAGGTIVITNGRGGAFNGTGYGTFVVRGTVKGNKVHYTVSSSTYTSTVDGTLNAGATRITYSWVDSNKQKGTGYLERQGAPPPSTTTASTTTGSTTPTTPPPALPQVCVSIWTSNCAGILPPPPPVQTCVSLWQNCNGFGGNTTASPPVLNLSTDPTALSTPVGCQESSANPYTSQNPVPPVGGSAAGAGDSCSLLATVDTTTSASHLTLEDLQRVWDTNETNFHLLAQSFSTALTGSADVMCSGISCSTKDHALASAVFQLIRQKITGIYSYWVIPGQPIVPGAYQFDLSEVCSEAGVQGYLLDTCNAMAAAIQDAERGYDDILVSAKHGCDTPRPTSLPTNGTRMIFGAPRAQLLVRLMVGKVTVWQGHHATLRLQIPKPAQQLIRRLQRLGITRLKATATITGRIIPGVQSVRKAHVILRLR